jgi:adenosylhomocysteine nucleosidase
MPIPQPTAENAPVILTALAAEKKALTGTPDGRNAARILQCGPGCATMAAQGPLPPGSTAVGSIGVSGGLVPGAEPGTIVLGEEIRNRDPLPGLAARYDCDPELVELLQSALEADNIPLLRGTLLCVEAPLVSDVEKAEAYRATGALAVDMESAGAAEVAARAGLPFFCLRVICDPAQRSLAPELFVGVDARGNSRPGRVAAMLLRRPWLLPQLITMARDFSGACRGLARAWESVRGPLARHAGR